MFDLSRIKFLLPVVWHLLSFSYSSVYLSPFLYFFFLAKYVYSFFCNRDDCGIFAIKFIELWDISTDLKDLFDQSDIPNIRIKLANEIFFSDKNDIDKSLVINLYQQVISLYFLKKFLLYNVSLYAYWIIFLSMFI